MLRSFVAANAVRQCLLLAFALTFTLFAVPVQLAAQPQSRDPVALVGGEFFQDLAPYVRYYEDEVNKLTPERALSSDFRTRFLPIDTALVDFGFTRSRIWLRIPVHNATARLGTWKLALDVPNVESVSVYLADGNPARPASLRKLLHIDDTMRFGRRPIPYRNLATDITLAANASAEILIAYSSKQATQLPILIESEDQFFTRVRQEDLHNWVLLALLVGMTLVSTVYLMALGFGTAGYYGAYILISGLYLFHTDGYAFQYIWPNAPGWNAIAVAPIGMTMVAAGCLFARSFVSAPRYHPRLNRLLLGSTGVAGVLACISFFALQYSWFKTGTLIFVVATAFLYLMSGILAAKRGQAGALFFVFGSLAIISTIGFGAIGYLNPGQFNQDVAGHYGRYALLFEGTAFSFAILLHILNLRRERDGALQREVRTAQEKLAMSEALVEAQKSHGHAMALAEARRRKLASTAHDIQQPLSSLRMAVTQLAGSSDKSVGGVQASFDYLDRIVQTNLEETKTGIPARDDHEHALQPAGAEEEFPVSVVLANVKAMFRDEARRKGVDLRVVMSDARVKTDPLALMRIVSNLVSNAVKYTESGRVLLGCRRRNGGLSIEVHDTGPGMSGSEIERLLRPYERGSDAPGTGLGLPLVQDLADAASLQFQMSSDPGRGTRATVCARLVEMSAPVVSPAGNP